MSHARLLWVSVAQGVNFIWKGVMLFLIHCLGELEIQNAWTPSSPRRLIASAILKCSLSSSPALSCLRPMWGSVFSPWPLANCVSLQSITNITCLLCFQVLDHNLVSVFNDTSFVCQTKGSAFTSRWLSEPPRFDCASSAELWNPLRLWGHSSLLPQWL